MSDYSRLKDCLEVPQRRVLSERDVLGRKYSALGLDAGDSMRDFVSRFGNPHLGSVQRLVVGLTAFERCEYLLPVIAGEHDFLKKCFKSGSLNLSERINDLVDCYDGPSYNGLIVFLNNLQGVIDSAGPFSGRDNFKFQRRINVLCCANFATSGYHVIDACVRSISYCSSAVMFDDILHGVSEERASAHRSQIINEIIDRAMCRLAFKDAYTADLGGTEVHNPRSGLFQLL